MKVESANLNTMHLTIIKGLLDQLEGPEKSRTKTGRDFYVRQAKRLIQANQSSLPCILQGGSQLTGILEA